MLAAVSSTQVLIWNPATGISVNTVTGNGSIRAITFSPDSKSLVSVWDNCELISWNPKTGEVLRELSGVAAFSFSPKGKGFAYTTTEHTLNVHTTSTDVQLFKSEAPVKEVEANTFSAENAEPFRSLYEIYDCVLFSPDGTKVAHLLHGRGVRVCDSSNGFLLYSLGDYATEAHSICFSPNGLIIISVSGQCICTWNASTGMPLREVGPRIEPLDFSYTCVSISPDGSMLAVGTTAGVINMWDFVGNRLHHTLDGQADHITSLSFSPDGKTLASTSRAAATANIWDVSEMPESTADETYRDLVHSIALSPDGETLATSSEDGKIQLSKMPSGKLIREFTSDPIFGSFHVSFSPNRKMLAMRSYSNGTLILCECPTGKEINRVEAKRLFRFSPDSTKLAVDNFENGRIEIWDTKTGKMISGLQGDSRILGIAFSSHGDLLASSTDVSIKIWHISAGVQLLSFGIAGPRCLAFLADDKVLVSSDGSTEIHFWDLENSFELENTALADWRDVRSLVPEADCIRARMWKGEDLKIFVDRNGCGRAVSDAENLYLEYNWICKAGERLLWIPSEYRGYDRCASRNTVVIKSQDGDVTILKYNHTPSTDKRLGSVSPRPLGRGSFETSRAQGLSIANLEGETSSDLEDSAPEPDHRTAKRQRTRVRGISILS